MTENSILDRYTNFEVEVLYLTDSGQYRDKGKLAEFDGKWIVLEKPANELFLIPVSAVRIVKVLGASKEKESLLLRPAEPEPEHLQKKITPKP